VVVICLTSFLIYLRLRSRQISEPPQVSSVQTTPLAQAPSPQVNEPKEPDRTASPPVRQAGNKKPTAAKASSSPSADTPAPTSEEDVAGVTRSDAVVPNLKLSEVKKIYIEIRGDAASNELRGNIVERLNSSGVVTAASDADDADAALKITVSQTSASAQLVNARGTVLWRKTSKVMTDVVNDLLSEIRLARH